MKKPWLTTFSMLASIAFLIGCSYSVSLAASAATGQAAATVNGKPIAMSAYTARVNRIMSQLSLTGQKVDPKQTSTLKTRILDSLIARELLKQEAEKKGIKADPAQVKASMDAIQKSTTPQNFAASLKQMDMTEADFRNYMATELSIKKLIDQELGSKVAVTPQEVKAFYDSNPNLFKTPEMVRASHILIKVDKNATAKQKAEALAKIKKIQKRIQKGADFATVAKQVSEDPGSRANGGDLNYFAKDQMVPSFANAAFALKPGQMSGIVKTRFGYHLIKVTAIKPPATVSFDKIKGQIEEHLKAQKMQKALPAYIDGLKSKAKIQIFVKS